MTVSIVIAARDAARFIGATLASAARQGDELGEIIVVDDGSTDATAAIVGSFPDHRVRLVSSCGQGVSAARNTGARLATGEWLMFLDADDLLREAALARLCAAAAASPDADVIYGDYDRIDAQGRAVGRRGLLKARRKPSGEVLQDLLAGNFIVNGGIMIVRKRVFDRLGGFDEALRFCEDWHCWCRLAAVARFRFLPEIVLDYRVHSANTMSSTQRSPADFIPAAERVFADALIVGRVPAAALAKLHEAATVHLIIYAAAQAVRFRSYSKAVAFAAQAVRRSASNLWPVALRLVSAGLGL
jgi:glycosyltransferase involved in cell wall biosynthesis